MRGCWPADWGVYVGPPGGALYMTVPGRGPPCGLARFPVCMSACPGLMWRCGGASWRPRLPHLQLHQPGATGRAWPCTESAHFSNRIH